MVKYVIIPDYGNKYSLVPSHPCIIAGSLYFLDQMLPLNGPVLVKSAEKNKHCLPQVDKLYPLSSLCILYTMFGNGSWTFYGSWQNLDLKKTIRV